MAAAKPAEAQNPPTTASTADPAAKPPAAPAQPAPTNGSPAKADPPAEPITPALPPRGYIPGSRRSVGLGLSPYAPSGPSLPGGVTIPFAGPEDESSEFKFKFSGYMSAALRLSSGHRDKPTKDQYEATFLAPPRTPDIYGATLGTNAPQGSWVELRFDYGNANVKSVVKISTWKPTAGETWRENSSQNFVNEAFLVFTLPTIADLSVNWTVGAFRNSYGPLGQYGAGQYNAAIIGSPFGVGETLSAKYRLSSSFSLVAEHGFMGRFNKVPIGAGPVVYDHDANPSKPSGFVHHAHLGFTIDGEVPFVFGLHLLQNFAQDERDQIDDPKTPFINEGRRPDASMNVYGADFRMLNNYLGNFALAASYADATYAQLLTGMNYYGADTGELLTKRLLGQQGGGTGKLLIAGFEYNFSWAKFLWYPEAYWGEGPDLVTSVFANVASVVESKDPNFDGRTLYKVGTEITYRCLSWLALSGRYDHVSPNSKDKRESFDVISPKLIFRSDWNSHEQVTLSYTRWFYGKHTHGEAPNDYTHEELDNQMFALSFGMWW
ncbi:Hypothetical protein A7982_04467 [Minicystis rosea]|nr:Hypothetical protein A7982_04467 [Minicystis rosea]